MDNITKIIDLEMTRGDTFELNLDAKNDDGSLIDFEEAYLTIRKNNTTSSEQLVQISLGNGITKNSDGTYNFKIDSELTKNIEISSRYYYDIQIKVNGNVYTPFKGKFAITWEVTDE